MYKNMKCWGCARTIWLSANMEYDLSVDCYKTCCEVWYLTDDEGEQQVGYWCAQRAKWWDD